jgi:structural maintenance of chromosome 1
VMGEELSAAKEAAKEAAEDFEEVKANRTAAFMLAFDHISREIDPIYKELTTKPGPQVLGGQAYLTCAPCLSHQKC